MIFETNILWKETQGFWIYKNIKLLCLVTRKVWYDIKMISKAYKCEKNDIGMNDEKWILQT